MQIECCVTEFGIRDSDYLQTEMTKARVKYESLRALSDNFAICRWVGQHAICDEDESALSGRSRTFSVAQCLCRVMFLDMSKWN